MQSRNMRGALGVAALSFLVGACNESSAPAEASKAPETGTQGQRLENGATVVATDAAGAPTFLVGELGVAPEIPAGEASALEQSALAPLVASLAPTFRLSADNLTLERAYTDAQGDSHYRYNVSHNGLRVIGGQLRLHARAGKIFAANTNVRSDLKAEAKASIAGEVAISAADSDKETVAGSVSEANPELAYYRVGDELKLVYVVDQKGEREDGTPIHDKVLVDAKTSDVVERHPQIHEALNRRMHDGKTLTTLPGVVVRTEGQEPTADPVVNTNYDHLGTVYNCYSQLFGRDSYNNAGAVLISTVHHRVRYVNAFWNGTQMVYGDGDNVTASNLANSLDVTGHELTHAVTSTESNLTYS
ncbi:MAG TPA: peptidase, partial [Myxococcus sp.]|nr:peptidase [Myxococcus sp.]